MNEAFRDPALIIIDVQQGFDQPKWGERNNPDAELQISKLLTTWRKLKLPVIHIQHLSSSPSSTFYPGTSGVEFKEIVKPVAGELIIQKNVNSAFIGTNLESYLRDNQIEQVIITGLTTPHCVSTTTRMSGNLGFETYIVSDATAAFELEGSDGTRYNAEQIHNITLATLHNEFATIVTAQEILDAITNK